MLPVKGEPPEPDFSSSQVESVKRAIVLRMSRVEVESPKVAETICNAVVVEINEFAPESL